MGTLGGRPERGQREAALSALQEAERLNPEKVNVRQMLAMGYDALRDAPTALGHYDVFLKLARDQGLAPEAVELLGRKAQALRETLTPQWIVAAIPTNYTVESLAGVLRERLG